MHSVLAGANQASGILAMVRARWIAALPAVAAVLLFKLAISDGGRDPAALMLAQTVTFVGVGLLVALRRTRVGSLGVPLLAMAGVTGISALWSVRPEATVQQLLLWAMGGGTVALVVSALPGRAAADRLLDALVFTAGWLVLIAGFMYWGAANPSMRWFATFYWPNPFAGFLLLALPIEAARCARAPRVRDGAVHGALTVLLGMGLVLTYSRGAWLSALAAGGLLLALFPRGGRARPALRLTVIALLIGAAVITVTTAAAMSARQGASGVVSRAASVADSGDLSIRGRMEFWRAAVAVFLDHPVLGTGGGTFGAVHAAYQRDARFFARDAHNLYLQTAAELGVLGLAALGGLLTALVLTARRALRGSGTTRDETPVAGVVAALAAFFLHSGVEMNWAFPAAPAGAFILMGVLAWHAQARTTPAPRLHPLLTSAALLALAALIAASGLGYAARQHYAAGQRNVRAGDWSAAAAAFARAARLNPLQPVYASMRAAVVMQGPSPDVRRARPFFERAMALDRMSAAHPLRLAYYLAMFPADPGASADGEALVRRALALDPRNRPEAYRFLARFRLEAGRPEEALEVYRLGGSQYAVGQFAGAVQHILLWPEIAALYEAWADAAARAGYVEEALEVLRRLRREDALWPGAYMQLAALHLRRRDLPAAEAALQAGLEQLPESEMLWVMWRTMPARRTQPWER